MPSQIQPLFLLSLPRSGSTLIQHMLAVHEKIATASEPWILLPYLYTLRAEGAYAEYSHQRLVEAIHDFYSTLPNGRADYEYEIRELALRLYEKSSSKECCYFLDKTPRYHLVAEDLMRLFPEAKYIFLWRNPLSIIASMITTFLDGKWKVWRTKVDLFRGLDNLVQAYDKHRDTVCALRYEDLVANPESECRRVLEYLELPFRYETLSEFNKRILAGRMGDPTGIKRYRQISSEPLDKWKQVLNNPVRKQWARWYVRWIGPERLAIMGYRMEDLLDQLETAPNSLECTGSDLLCLAYNVVHVAMSRLQEKRPAFS
jgi:hypothetical protein